MRTVDLQFWGVSTECFFLSNSTAFGSSLETGFHVTVF